MEPQEEGSRGEAGRCRRSAVGACSLSLSLPELIRVGERGPDMPDTGRHAGTDHTGVGTADTPMCSHPCAQASTQSQQQTCPFSKLHTGQGRADVLTAWPQACTDSICAHLRHRQDERHHQHLCKHIHRHTGLQHEPQIAVIFKTAWLGQGSGLGRVNLGGQRSVVDQLGLPQTPCQSGWSFQECVCFQLQVRHRRRCLARTCLNLWPATSWLQAMPSPSQE